MGIGGGEWLSSLPGRPAHVATESWPPNVRVAAARLRPLGIGVVHDEGAVDNVAQHRGEPRGRLAFREGAFDLVVNRHEAFVAEEVRRVLRPGGVFVTQQADWGSRRFHELLGLQPPTVEEFRLELALKEVTDAGLRSTNLARVLRPRRSQTSARWLGICPLCHGLCPASPSRAAMTRSFAFTADRCR
jgi:SAM-dependent methyltransferase